MRLLPVLALLLAAVPARSQDNSSEPKSSFPPSPEAVKKGRDSIRDILKADYVRRGARDREALGRKLLQLALDTKGDPAMKTALLLESRETATLAGDVDTALAAFKELPATKFPEDPKARMDALEAIVRAAKTKESAGAPAAAALAASEEAATAGDFDLAERAAGVAETAAKAGRDVETLNRAREVRDAVREQKKEYARVESAVKKLADNPADPEANLAAGKYFCFVRQDWAKGLPLLAKGGDARLVEIADREAADPKEPKAQFEVADLWWGWSEKAPTRDKQAAQERAMKWYEEALPKLTIIDKARAEKRIQAATEAAVARAGGLVQPGNVALAKNGATVSGTINYPDELLNGVTTGHTGSTGYAYGHWPCEWIVTLPRPYVLRQVRMLLWDGEDRFYRYALETSPDGQTYTSLVDRSQGEWKSWQTILFPPRRVKTIKVKGLHNSANAGFHVVELEAYCIPPTTSAVPRTKFPAASE
jgi:hypothetical protein